MSAPELMAAFLVGAGAAIIAEFRHKKFALTLGLILYAQGVARLVATILTEASK